MEEELAREVEELIAPEEAMEQDVEEDDDDDELDPQDEEERANLNAMYWHDVNSAVKIEGRWICPICENAFKQKTHLNQHIKVVHYKIKEKPCEFCDKSFSTNFILQTHVRSVHRKLKSFVCEICNKEFFTQKSAHNHVTSKKCEGKMENIIDIRGMEEEQLESLGVKRETIEELTGVESSEPVKEEILEPEVICQTDVDGVKKEGEEENNENEENESNNQRNTRYRFECESCGKKFFKENHYENHLKLAHKLNKEYVCQICSKNFSSSIGLKRHLLAHEDNGPRDKSFACEMCDKKFS